MKPRSYMYLDLILTKNKYGTQETLQIVHYIAKITKNFQNKAKFAGYFLYLTNNISIEFNFSSISYAKNKSFQPKIYPSKLNFNFLTY